MHKGSEPAPGGTWTGAASAKRLDELLVERNDVQQADIDKALQIQRSVGGRLGPLLVRTGAISEDVLLQRLAEQQGARHLRSAEDLPDSLDVYQFMSESPIKLDWFLDHAVLMWRRDEALCCIARDILDHALRATLNYFYPGEAVTYCLAANHQIDRLLDFVKKERAIESLYSGDSAKQLREMAEEAPIIELVNNLLSQAVDLSASDIHVEPAEEQFAVRMRVDGVLHTRLTQPVERFPAVASRIKLISGIDIAERRLPQDGRISTRISGSGRWTFASRRCPARSASPSCSGCSPRNATTSPSKNLGMEGDHLGALPEAGIHANNGIVLVTGPTGSGKSTTLAAGLQDIDDGIKKIITVEDPVEHQMPNITQIQTHAEIGYTFARALRAILRQDPDVIMIGEIRDLETAEIAIRSALTGHLVLSTVAHQRRPLELHPAHRHGGGAVPGRGPRARGPGAAPRAKDLPALRPAHRAALPPQAPSSKSHSTPASSGTDGCGSRAAKPAATPATAAGPGSTSWSRCPTELQDLIVAGAKLNDLKGLARSNRATAPCCTTASSRRRTGTPPWRRSPGSPSRIDERCRSTSTRSSIAAVSL